MPIFSAVEIERRHRVIRENMRARDAIVRVTETGSEAISHRPPGIIRFG